MGGESSRARPLSSSNNGRNDRDDARHAPFGGARSPTACRCPTAVAVPGDTAVHGRWKATGHPRSGSTGPLPAAPGLGRASSESFPAALGLGRASSDPFPAPPGTRRGSSGPFPPPLKAGTCGATERGPGNPRDPRRDGRRPAPSCRSTRSAGRVPGVLRSDQSAFDAFPAVGGSNRASTDLLPAV